MISPQQCRAARILIQVDRPLLAAASGVSAQAILSFERSGRSLPDAEMLALRQALEGLGAEFIREDAMGGAGVRLRFDADQSRKISDWEAEGGRVGDDDVP
ncbi:XRE family transcriptional regulator [Mesorhizobium sp.]|uniref:XRE family transcriptional regulator n=1 Tax=Mesorhizobium sp. TaxID=1871066 RepID=UPI00120C7A5B|nr:XRE family transcriptional regulator [Mesorhizobium sp.]TIO11077.1 MAG: XRE family transcriptional regulator [Mesorhizobium sp.]TIO32796.1 MAG: XRE family transcriptional regulator [Mesorhizobium sp.]